VGLADVFQQGAQAIRGAFDDVPEDLVYNVYATTVFTPGSLTEPVKVSTEVAVKGFVVGIADREIDNLNILAKDRRVLIASLDMPTVTPDENDWVVRPNGEVLEIVRIKVDPARALWQLQVREP
jgi:hypothetical protein